MSSLFDENLKTIFLSIGTSVIVLGIVSFLELLRAEQMDEKEKTNLKIIEEGGIENIFKRRDLEEYKEIVYNAKKSIDITGYSLRGFYESNKDIILEKCEKYKNFLVRIILVNPSSQFSENREYIMGRRLAMDEKKFENVAVTQNNDNWETLTKRKTNLYGRKDDIRSEFARDYTRVLHSLAYRRLKHKTQVFFNAAGNDHICTRIEHVQHVESVSNTVAKCLGLNEELTRAIAIAHDLGHAPFGHQGESVIQKWTKEYLKKDFWHEQNGVYFVDNVELLEDNQRKLRNLDLTYAVRDGIISHCGEVDENAIRPRTELFDLKKFGKAGEYQAATWEGCVVKLADKIAYLGRDIEDAIRLGYLSEGEMNTLREMAQVHNQEAMNTTVIMHNMIIDLCNNSSVEKGLLLSKTMADQLDAIKKFNQDKIYRNPRLDTFKKYSKLVLNEIFGTLLSFYDNCQGDIMVCLMKMKNDEKKFVNDFAEWIVQYCTLNFKEPTYAWAKKISDNCENKKIYMELSQRTQYIQAVVDFVAGMTDVYAINAFDELLRC